MYKANLTIGVDEGFSEHYKVFLERKYILEIHTFKDIIRNYDNGDSIKGLDLLVFTGGADVNPDMYGENVGKYTSLNKKRDEEAKRISDIYYFVPKLGICRGSQFLTVLSGGNLVQHVEGHANGNHNIILDRDLGLNPRLEITSTHHQMMYPFNLGKNSYTILAHSEYHKSNTYLNGDNEEITLPVKFVEPEIVYYPSTNALAIQGHPEMAHCPTKTKSACIHLIDTYLIKKNKK